MNIIQDCFFVIIIKIVVYSFPDRKLFPLVSIFITVPGGGCHFSFLLFHLFPRDFFADLPKKRVYLVHCHQPWSVISHELFVVLNCLARAFHCELVTGSPTAAASVPSAAAAAAMVILVRSSKLPYFDADGLDESF